MSLETGEILDGKYRIVRLIGEGGMGAVYEGENTRIRRRVAIKVLHAGLTANEEVTQRFEREAQAAGRIGNDHILEVIDLGVLANGDRFIVMEYLDGEPLGARIAAKKRLSPAELAPLMRQTLVGLGAAHNAGIVHRDLKPDNIYVLKSKAGRPDFVKIIDFGISKFQPLGSDGMKMTRTGAVMGTPYYMSPEQASGSGEADRRSDLYSVGVMMFEAVTGQVPFDGTTFNQLMFKIVLADVPRPEALVPDLDPAFASIISKAMARDATQRFQTAEDFCTAIDAWSKSGTAVSVPPTADPAATALMPPGGGVPSQPRRPTPATGGTWATPADSVPMKKGPSPGLLVGLLVGVCLAGAGGAYALLGGSPKPSPEPPGTAADAPTATVAAPTVVPEPSKPEPSKPEPQASVAAPSEVPPAPSASVAVPTVVPLPKAKARPVARPATPGPAKPSQKPGATPDFGY